MATDSFAECLRAGGHFQGYAYGYPHKTAYRSLHPAQSLAEVWGGEDKSALFLYLHIPFCEMRCGFCNLFTTTHLGGNLIGRHFAALREQADRTLEALGSAARFSRIAIGGGTPTVLGLDELAALFQFIKRLPVSAKAPLAIEVSPGTVSVEKLSLLGEAGVTRVSMGVQSLVAEETRALGRPQDPFVARKALALISRAGIPVRNVDLIYGIAGQTAQSWLVSLNGVLEYSPEEIYLYPLYVRPLTLLGNRWGGAGVTSLAEDSRLALYRVGRDLLLEAGYRQISMRLFRRQDSSAREGPVYCCQEDGMVGLGAGARSYTRGLHYSTEWAVSYKSVREIIERYVAEPARFGLADYGIALAAEEQQRRYVIKSILRSDGLDLAAYSARFGSGALDDCPQLSELVAAGALKTEGGALVPTRMGLELSDAIGPWLYSQPIQSRMGEFVVA